MRVVAIAFSARRHGNCRDIAERILERLQEKGIETELLMAADYEINPCNCCSYECFYEDRCCPIDDDVPIIWEKMKEADGIALAIPSYYGLPPATFKAAIERAQGILKWVDREIRDLEGVWRDKPVVVAVVADGGGEMIIEYLRHLLRSAKVTLEHISYMKYGRSGFEGGLIEMPEVSLRVEELAREIYLKLIPRAS